MTVRPSKTDRYGIEINNVPLNELAIALLEDEKKFQKNGKYFALYSGQYANRKLKQIAQALNIDHNIHFHVGRSTFASMYDQAGGNHRSLLEYMGLTKMETLMKYVQTNQEVISESIGKMNLTFSSASARV
jgi:site-specific recombinase XerD